MTKIKKLFIILTVGALIPILAGCQPGMKIASGNIAVEFDNNMNSRLEAMFAGKTIPIGDFGPAEEISIAGETIGDFLYQSQSTEDVNDATGKGTRLILTGASGSLVKTVSVTLYDDFPAMAVFNVSYTNQSGEDLQVDGWVNNQYAITAGPAQDSVNFWSYQSGSYESRPDWVLPVKPGFSQQNYMGMNDSDYGGGTPISDVWRRDVGIAVGHLEVVPKLVSLPVIMADDKEASLAVAFDRPQTLKSGETLNTFTTFVAVHQGDYYAVLDSYRRMMDKRGVKIDPPLESAYEPIWCAWGYERNFNVEQVLNTLPMVKKLGFKWAVLDDGWQTAEGDWYLLKQKFPQGDADMKKFVQAIKDQGLKAKLWWAPLAVDPGTDLIKEHPEYLLLNEDGSEQKISWWDAYYLCPAVPEVQEFTRGQVKLIMETWGYEGLKIDGQHLNGAPPCYNPAHNHARPEEGFEKIPEFFKVIYDEALKINPDAVVEICPCGTAYSFFNLAYMNQPVSSDPTSSWQIRLKGKTLKGLMGPSAAYYGDHVELSDDRTDFASTVGVGAVIGTKFTWPVGAHKPRRPERDISLTPEKEKVWKQWVDIYEAKMLPKGEYMGTLYDIGFDKPEAHAISKDGNMYYAFYAKEWSGDVELRGLGSGTYQVTDYENNVDLGAVTGPLANLNVSFNKHLLIEVKPVK